ncbi:MAG: DPP IV N-terminal domain-containing protein [Bacteroidetes bacterium]|nr:DPP IV N-terminal domain-containing protein [Bacteroidota bacterium]
MRIVCLLIIGLLGFPPAGVLAQDKLLTLEDASGWSLYPRGMAQLAWVPGGGARYSYREGQEHLVIDAATAKEVHRLRTIDLNKALAALGKTAVTNLPGLSWNPDGSLRFVANGELFRYDLKTGQARFVNTYPRDAAHLDLEPNALSLAYTRGHNLYISEGGVEKDISQNTDPQVKYGEAAHRQEFGITKGTFWSPQGTALAFYRMDETPVSDIPLLDITSTPVQDHPFKYPMAGQATHLVTVGVYHLKSGERVYLETGDPKDTYLTNLTWSPDEQSIYLALLNRDQNHMRLVQYDARTGKPLRTLFEERDSSYVEPQHGLDFLPGKGDHFLWQSRRDGWNHLYLYRTDGTLVRQLTHGQWEVTDFLGFSPDGEYAYYTGTQESPLERHLYRVPVSGKAARHESSVWEATRLTTHHGTHTTQLSPDGKYLLDTWTGLNEPGKTLLRLSNGKEVKVLHTTENPLKGFAPVEISLQTLRAPDGSLRYTRTLFPPGFDNSKRYPVLVYTYGGPHAQMVTHSWLGGASLFLYYLAQQGYVVFTLDGRGSSYRGKAFEQVTFRRLGVAAREDQLLGVQHLKSQPWADSTRIGVHGWSFGGFLTASLLLHHPGVFRCGIAGAPVTDWKYYEIMYTERYMDTPQANPQGYAQSSLPEAARNLKDRLLVIHGTADDVVVWQHTLSLMDACIKAGTLPDYFVYPGHDHHVRGADRLHLHKYMARYLDEHLKR